MDLAGRLIDEMTVKWKADQYHDEYRDALMDFIEKKIAGGKAVTDVKQSDTNNGDGTGSKVLDLAEYLERSIKRSPSQTVEHASSKRKPQAKKTTNKNATQKIASKKGRRSA